MTIDNFPADPRTASLARHSGRLQARLAELRRLDRVISWSRLAWVVASIVLTALAWFWPWPLGGRTAGLLVGVVALIGFVLVVRQHRRIEESIRRHSSRLAFVQAQIARTTVDWSALPPPLEASLDPAHAFAVDLDLAGERSLHRLIDTAVSAAGSERLLEWLSAVEPEADAIERRQSIARELEHLPIFRSRLALEATMARDGERRRRAPERRDGRWEADRMAKWLTTPPELHGKGLDMWTDIALILGVSNAALFIVNQLELVPRIWPITLGLYVSILLGTSRSAGDPFTDALSLHGAIEPLIALFRRIERFGYERSPHLAALCAPLRTGEHRPSITLPRVSRLVAAASVRGNAMLWLALHAIVPWDLLVGRALKRRHAEIAAHAPAWMNALYDLEALCGLANIAGLRAGTTWPELRDDGPMLNASGLGHPLLSDRAIVRNDVAMGQLGEIMLITGSNMSGKSTFLRTLGVSTALAQAGGPVIAHEYSARLARLFSSLSIDDSVTDGISTFYAEVRRLRSMLDSLEAGEAASSAYNDVDAGLDDPTARPLFFLVDELYRGTNNRERLAGSRALIRTLVGRRAVGVISTHDLDLVRLADELPSLRNAHFRDDVSEGRMTFDYTLHEGPCPTTNALRVMALGGLPVDEVG